MIVRCANCRGPFEASNGIGQQTCTDRCAAILYDEDVRRSEWEHGQRTEDNAER